MMNHQNAIDEIHALVADCEVNDAVAEKLLPIAYWLEETKWIALMPRLQDKSTQVNSLIADDGFTVSVNDVVLIDGQEVSIGTIWADGKILAWNGDDFQFLDIEDIELSIPGSLMISNH